MSAAKPDVVVIGGGHNGLVTAALLAKGGLKTMVLERREKVGGAAVTEEFHPGFKASTIAHTAALRPAIARELGLDGLQMIEAEPRVFAPLPDGRSLSLWGNPLKSATSLRAFSASDADRYQAFHQSLGAIAALLVRVLEMTPPDLSAPVPRDLFSMAGVGMRFRGLGRDDAHRLLRWGPMAVADFAAEWFETELMRAVVCARGIAGIFAGPWSAGTTANLLLQSAATGGNGAGSAVLVKGGLGALSETLAERGRRHGVEVRTGAEVARISTSDGRATGVVLASGEEIAARAVVSGADFKATFLKMLDATALDPDELRRVRNFQQVGMASKVNLALSELPPFRALRATKDGEASLVGRIHVSPDVDSLERAFDAAKYGSVAARPYLDITIPSLSDPSLAPAGKHVMSVYVQYTPFCLASGDWDSRREEIGDAVLATLEDYAPGIGARVVHRQVLTPLDLEKHYGLTGGHPFHGEPSLNQLFTMRPLLGWARYRSPIRGLYLCSAATHPGGGVTGGPGANAAREILHDLR
jgi:phytoene dehydrogenase-like protein